VSTGRTEITHLNSTLTTISVHWLPAKTQGLTGYVISYQKAVRQENESTPISKVLFPKNELCFYKCRFSR